MNLNEYGFTKEMEAYIASDEEKQTNGAMADEAVKRIPARIIAEHRERYALVCEHGEIYGRLKTKEYYGGEQEFPTIGDFVLINYIPTGDSQIVATLPRKTFFSRRNPTPGRGEQLVAANFDYVFIMQSLNMDFNPKRLERYLTLAWQSGATPIIILTKADLMDDFSSQLASVELVAPGVSVHVVSAKTGYGLENLSSYLSLGKTIVFLGSSGIGKSSLVNALAGEEIMAVNGIREDDSKGRHTTTHRQLIKLACGAMIIDTPGMRELGMWDVTVGLGEAFSDVEQYIGQCKFSDCKHLTEPGCAIKAALENGELSMKRWQSYLNLEREAQFSESKSAYLRQKQARNKSISVWSKQMKSSKKYK